MVDLRTHVILIRPSAAVPFDGTMDETADVESITTTIDGRIKVSFGRDRTYRYAPDRVLHLTSATLVPIADQCVEVDGVIWTSVQEVIEFADPFGGRWWRVIWRSGRDSVTTNLFAGERIRVLRNPSLTGLGSQVLRYWRSVAEHLPDTSPTKSSALRLFNEPIHPESALARFVNAIPPSMKSVDPLAPIFPFRFNLSQRTAVEYVLTSSLTVIEGPPGTGKTQTILNAIANIVATGTSTVGVVSLSNSAVDNVAEKLDAEGFSFIVAALGRAEKRNEFISRQGERNRHVNMMLSSPTMPPDANLLASLGERLRHLQSTERELAALRVTHAAYTLEYRHFTNHLIHHEVPDLNINLPLLSKDSERILDCLAENEIDRNTPRRRGLLKRVRNYFRYGSLHGLDPSDSVVILRLQEGYYDRRIAELGNQINEAETALRTANYFDHAELHRALSRQQLSAALDSRYRSNQRVVYDAKSITSRAADFGRDYPVILSTCHSLATSIGRGRLLDYLIIDEASQVDLLTAALAMACCRNLVVVGDSRQLAPISSANTNELRAPETPYDYQKQSLLTAIDTLYGDRVPRVLLREHYRCHPAIIGFCNKRFYENSLIPYTTGYLADQPLVVRRLAEGNHARRVTHSERGMFNQREIDDTVNETLARHCTGVPDDEIGIATPYNLQVGKMRRELSHRERHTIAVHTVHKFQGREKQVVVLSPVIDESKEGHFALKFVDDPRLINVAVSRASSKFILVTHHDQLRRSTYLRDLIDYIRYYDPSADVEDSSVISVFDLLYRDYSKRLQPLATRLLGRRRYRSEDVIDTVLHQEMTQDAYRRLAVLGPMRLINLLPNRDLLDTELGSYVSHGAELDFVIYHKISNRLEFAIEVDGFAFHENKPIQLDRDARKDEICRRYGIPLLRLPTTRSDEIVKIRAWLDRAVGHENDHPDLTVPTGSTGPTR